MNELKNLELNCLMLHKLNTLLSNYNFTTSRGSFELNYNYNSEQIKTCFSFQSFFQNLFEIKDSNLYLEFNRTVPNIDPLIYTFLSCPSFRLYLSFEPKSVNFNCTESEDEEILIINWLHAYIDKIKTLTVKNTSFDKNIVGSFFNDFYANINDQKNTITSLQLSTSIRLRKCLRNFFIRNDCWFENPTLIFKNDLVRYFNFYHCFLKSNENSVIINLFKSISENRSVISEFILIDRDYLLFTVNKSFDSTKFEIKNKNQMNILNNLIQFNQFLKVELTVNTSTAIDVYYNNKRLTGLIDLLLAADSMNEGNSISHVTLNNIETKLDITRESNFLTKIVKITKSINFLEQNKIVVVKDFKLNQNFILNSNAVANSSYLNLDYFSLDETDDLSLYVALCINIFKKLPTDIYKMILKRFDHFKLFYCITANDLLALKVENYFKNYSFESIRLYGFLLNSNLIMSFTSQSSTDLFNFKTSIFDPNFSQAFKKRLNNFKLNQVVFEKLTNLLGLDIILKFEIISLDNDEYIFNYENLIKNIIWCKKNDDETMKKISLKFSLLDSNKSEIDIKILTYDQNIWFYNYKNIYNTFKDTITYEVTLNAQKKSLNFHHINEKDTGFFVFKSAILKTINSLYVRLKFDDMFSNCILYDFHI